MKLILERKAPWVFIIFLSAILAEVSLQETGTLVTLEPDGTRLITVAEGHYVELNITFPISHGSVCFEGIYFEIRDGLNQSANLLGVFCGFHEDKEYVFRSSRLHMWLKFHRYRTSYNNSAFHVKYTSKQMNVTVAPVLIQVKTTQFVLYNHSSFLWCPAEGAPAPVIFWRKDGNVVQNTTSVRYELGIVKGNNVTYSCEVKNNDQLTKKELVLYIERCPGPCQCKHFKGTHSLLRVLCGGKQLKLFPWTLPLATAVFNLSNNQLQQLPEEVFSKTTELRTLFLTNNQLQQLPEGVFCKNTELRTLDLSNNQLQQLREGVFSNNTKLVYLDLSNNQLQKLSEGFFSNNTKLVSLDLSNNQLQKLPEGFFSNNTKLGVLYLSNNQLQKLPEVFFSNNTKLLELRLDNNNLKQLPGDLFTGLVNLGWLDLSNNQLQKLPEGFFSNNTKLGVLFLDSNDLKQLPGDLFTGLVNLGYLYLSHNQLQNLPPEIFKTNTGLYRLQLHNNKLSELKETLFHGLGNLRDLWLQDNNIKELPSSLFKDLIRLEELDISNNEVRVLPEGLFNSLTKLTELSLPNNQIEDLPPGIFANLTALKTLYLSENKLQDLPPGIFKGPKGLLSMFMHYNEMNELPDGFFKNLKDIMRVSADTNLMCCHMKKEDADCEFAYNDNFASCESMFRNPAPKKSIWVIGIFSLIGSVFVICWRLIFKEKNVVQTIMLMHLAVSDGLMGVYLLTVGIKDLQWSGEYYLHDYKWRTGWSCQITGAISLLSSEVSVMTMTLISADRLKNIVYPYQGSALTRKMTHALCFLIWAVAFCIAFFPMIGIEYFNDPVRYHTYYGRSVVCLPLQLSSDKLAGWEYSVALFVGLNFVFFLFIMIAYLMILYKSCASSRRMARQGTAREIQARSRSANSRRETALAKRVFCIILTDCLCWMPVIVIGLQSILEKSFTAPGDLAVWIAVFALPINSALNPILYTLSTPQVQGILRNKVSRLWNYLKSIFFCCGHDQEEGNGEGQQNQQGIEDNVPHDEEAGEGEGGMIELVAVGLPHAEQGGVRKRTTIRRTLSFAPSDQSKEVLEAEDIQPQLSIKKKRQQDKELESTECQSSTDEASSTRSKATLGEETTLYIYETAL